MSTCKTCGAETDQPTHTCKKPLTRLRYVRLIANINACNFTSFDARERIAEELRRIAGMVEEGSTISESGGLSIADHGRWEIFDEFEKSDSGNP